MKTTSLGQTFVKNNAYAVEKQVGKDDMVIISGM